MIERVCLVAVLLLLPAAAGCSSQRPPAAQPASPSPSPPATSSVPSVPSVPSTPAAPAFPAALRGKDIERIPTSRSVVALTFDAGANADAVPSILATLARENVPATFFLTGDFVEDFPDASASIGRTGNPVGNHTETHPHLPQLSDGDVRSQIRDAGARIRAATGRDPKPYFRFPYGDRDTRTIGIVNAEGYFAVRWTTDSLGWQGKAKHTAASVATRVVAGAQPGQIVLMHMGSNPDDKSILDADALPAIISGLRAKGYTFVTLEAMLT